MNAATVEPPTAQAAVYREISIRQLFDSALNPRRRFDDTKVQELAQSIRSHGVIEPLVVRPRVAGGYEVIAGHYRIRAVMAAGLDTAPCVCRQLTDVETLEVMLIENKQRADVHPLDEADGYRRLRELDPVYTPVAIAAKVGVDVSYVYRRLKLLDLIPDVREVFEKDEITAAHAERLARLTPDQQTRALPECFYQLFSHVPEPDGKRRDVQPVARLDQWIREHTRIQPAHEDTAHYFPEIAAVVETQTEEDMPAATLLELSDSFMPGPLLGKNHGAIARRSWVAVTSAKHRCPHTTRGVVVHGGPPRVLDVCAHKACTKHFKRQATASGRVKARANQDRQQEKWEAERRKQEERRKAWDALCPEAMKAFAAHVKDQKVTARLMETALGHDVKKVRSTGVAITDANVGQVLAILCVRDWTRDEFVRSVKPFGFHLGVCEKSVKTQASNDTSAKGKRTKTVGGKKR